MAGVQLLIGIKGKPGHCGNYTGAPAPLLFLARPLFDKVGQGKCTLLLVLDNERPHTSH